MPEWCVAFGDHTRVWFHVCFVAAAKDAVKGKTEMDALVAYLQSLGHALK